MQNNDADLFRLNFIVGYIRGANPVLLGQAVTAWETEEKRRLDSIRRADDYVQADDHLQR